MTTRTVLENQLEEIRDDLLRMGSLVDQAIDRAVTALQERDVSLAQQVVDDDEVLNGLRYKVESDCVHVFATQQPMASDLRQLIAAMNIAIDLERMGDHAEGTAKTLVTEGADAVGDLTIDLPRMAEMCRQMLRLAMDALLEENVEKARQAARIDDELDHLYKQTFSDLIDRMVGGKLLVSRGTYLLWGAHNMERIGDRVTNICERVEFATTGNLRDLNP
jgi:phosphate transport system protein